MTPVKLAGIAVFSAIVLLLLRQLKPEMAAPAAILCGALLLLAALPYVQQIIDGIEALAAQGGVQQAYLTRLMKITGVSLLMDFAAQTCRDAGENGLALKTELAGRMLLLTLALPAMQVLLKQILTLAP